MNRWTRIATVFILATAGLAVLAPTASAHGYDCIAGRYVEWPMPPGFHSHKKGCKDPYDPDPCGNVRGGAVDSVNVAGSDSANVGGSDANVGTLQALDDSRALSYTTTIAVKCPAVHGIRAPGDGATTIATPR